MKLSIFCIILIACVAATLRAQIRYTDITPDTVLVATLANPSAMYDLDINGDGTADFNIVQFHPAESTDIAEMNCSQYQQCEVLVDGSGVPRRLARDESIDAGGSLWFDSHTNAMHMGDNWRGAIDGFLGLRVRKNGAWYYGWARLDVAANERTVTVKDYAAEMTADAGTTAGAGISTGIESSSTKRNISYRVAGAALIIERGAGPLPAELIICDISGRMSARHVFSGTLSHVDLSGFRPGAYLLAVRSGDAVITGKFLFLSAAMSGD